MVKYSLEYEIGSDRDNKIVDPNLITLHKSVNFTTQLSQSISLNSTVNIDWNNGNYQKLTLLGKGIWINLPTTNVNVGRYELLIVKTNNVDFAEFKDPDSYDISRYVEWPYGPIVWPAGVVNKNILITFKWDGIRYWAIQTPWF
jgi:hypothetical protein